MDILSYPVLVQAGSRNSVGRVALDSVGRVALDLDLLKPWRVLASADAHDATVSPALRREHSHEPHQVYLEYAYRKHHPVLQWLPTKLAE